MDDIDSDHLIKALEQMDLPPMPARVQALIDASPPYLVELLRAMADDMEHPGKGAAALAALPPEARIIEQALRDNPTLCYTGLLEISKKGQRLRREARRLELESANAQRKMLPDNRLH
jgi:hypothetical protein